MTKKYFVEFFKFSCKELSKHDYGTEMEIYKKTLNSYNLLPENALAKELKKDKGYWERACSYLIRSFCTYSNTHGKYATYSDVESKLKAKYHKSLQTQEDRTK